MSASCPYCPDEPYETPSGWGMSEEGWQEARENHERYHCDRCPCCGQYKVKKEFGYYPEDPLSPLNSTLSFREL